MFTPDEACGYRLIDHKSISSTVTLCRRAPLRTQKPKHWEVCLIVDTNNPWATFHGNVHKGQGYRKGRFIAVFHAHPRVRSMEAAFEFEQDAIDFLTDMARRYL